MEPLVSASSDGLSLLSRTVLVLNSSHAVNYSLMKSANAGMQEARNTWVSFRSFPVAIFSMCFRSILQNDSRLSKLTQLQALICSVHHHIWFMDLARRYSAREESLQSSCVLIVREIAFCVTLNNLAQNVFSRCRAGVYTHRLICCSYDAPAQASLGRNLRPFPLSKTPSSASAMVPSIRFFKPLTGLSGSSSSYWN